MICPGRQGNAPIGEQVGGNLSLPQPCRNLQGLNQTLHHRRQVRLCGPLARGQAAKALQNRGHILHHAPCDFDEPSTHIQAAGLGDMPGFHQGQIAGSAADVHVENRFAGLCRKSLRTCAFGGQDTLQVRAGGGHHKLPGKFLQAIQHCPGIFLPGSFPGDDDGAGGYPLGLDPRQPVFLCHNLPDACCIQLSGRPQRGEVNGAPVQDLPVSDGEIGNRIGIGRFSTVRRERISCVVEVPTSIPTECKVSPTACNLLQNLLQKPTGGLHPGWFCRRGLPEPPLQWSPDSAGGPGERRRLPPGVAGQAQLPAQAYQSVFQVPQGDGLGRTAQPCLPG